MWVGNPTFHPNPSATAGGLIGFWGHGSLVPMLSYEEAAAVLGWRDSNASMNATINGVFVWNGQTVIVDDDDEGTAGVREPRRPRPSPLAPAAMALIPSFA